MIISEYFIVNFISLIWIPTLQSYLKRERWKTQWKGCSQTFRIDCVQIWIGSLERSFLSLVSIYQVIDIFRVNLNNRSVSESEQFEHAFSENVRKIQTTHWIEPKLSYTYAPKKTARNNPILKNEPSVKTSQTHAVCLALSFFVNKFNIRHWYIDMREWIYIAQLQS